MRQGKLLGGKTTVPELIRANRAPYIAALREADDYLKKTGQFNVSALADYLADLLAIQLQNADADANAAAVVPAQKHPNLHK